MNNIKTTNWIKSLTDQAQKEDWCVRSGCTTCGSLVFRSSLIKKCFQNNNLAFPDKTRPSRRSKNLIIVDLFSDDIKFCVKTISKELANLNAEDMHRIDTGALRIIFTEIYSPRGKYSDTTNVKLIHDILGDSPAGYYLKSMENHSKRLEEQYIKHEINNNPKILEENRRIKKEFKAKAHAKRIIKYNKFSFIKKYWFKFKNLFRQK